MHLHEFLTQVHKIVAPGIYLEVGVQHGTSLYLASASERAIGIDPMPLTSAQRNQTIFKMTSDEFFAEAAKGMGTRMEPDKYKVPYIDLGFIDGLHHYEQALRDFVNMEEYTHTKSVIIFDDVLPRNQEEAARDMCPGDWTGDVWKVIDILIRHRPELRIVEVDTQPTGTLVVWDFYDDELTTTDPETLMRLAMDRSFMDNNVVPDWVLHRDHAVSPQECLAELEGFLNE